MPLRAEDLPHVDAAALAGMIDPKTTALVVVDIQVDFAAPQGLLGRYGVDLSPAEAAIDNCEKLVAAARGVGATVALMRVVTSPETDSRALKTLMVRRGQPGGEAICRVADGGADYYRIFPEAGDIEIAKLLYDSFHGTDFDAQLRARGIQTLVICGLSTDCCVDQTARSAFHHDYDVFLVSDASAAYEPGLHESSLSAMEKNCVLLTTTDAALKAWSA
ncbi:nicotinamidase-related amidase [Novosphingobium sp. PhB165]|uniref:cysteine hydrolase family protein n=1 Tax=Novosphingobium sp. PhB165 TaxID=2485105 RepID=UPI001045E7CB|nr:isochorismatase family cysteine hydrolase [Novosphingobium sp. PhB165]TCM17121.1 nicotinamidase-related amidase [Novosphingobium sp. PhB165]